MGGVHSMRRPGSATGPSHDTTTHATRWASTVHGLHGAYIARPARAARREEVAIPRCPRIGGKST